MEKVILIGNPNVGKSVLFSQLTGELVTIANYPGTTVQLTSGVCQFKNRKLEIIDTPGLYSLVPFSKEEMITKQLLEQDNFRWVLHVVDAKNLARMLPVTLQLIRHNYPVILVVNMLDEAAHLGIKLDLKQLSALLGIPVIGTVGTQGQGINEIIETIFSRPAKPKPKQRLPQTIDYEQLYQLAEEARYLSRYITTREQPITPWSTLDKILLTPITGLPIACFVLYLLFYKLVGQVGAGIIVDFLDERVFSQHLLPFCERLVLLVPWPAIQDLLIGEFGLITLAIRYACAIILPIIGVFFFVFSILEDTGYLPRLAFLLNRSLNKLGLSGQGIIPLVLGLGCGTMATAVTRTLETERERKIAIFLLALTIPCSAQLGLIMALLSTNTKALLIWFTTVLVIFLWSGTLLNLLLPGLRPTFSLELPPLRIPYFIVSLQKTIARMSWYFWEILPIFMITSICIWLAEQSGLFPKIIMFLESTVSILGLPKQLALPFLLGFLRRDYGAAGLYDLQELLNWQQLTIACTVLTLFIPCLAQFTVIVKETSLIWAFTTLLIIMAIGFFTGLTLQWLLV